MAGGEANNPQRVSGRCRIFSGAVLALLLLFGVGCETTPRQLFLEVAACDSDKVLLRQKTQPQSEFSVRFLHSYDRSFFEEHYRVLGTGQILLTHMTFKSSLNGQGFAMGAYRSRPDGSAELADINQELEKVFFRLGSPDLANHTLTTGGRTLRLLDYAQAGDLLCIQIRTQ